MGMTRLSRALAAAVLGASLVTGAWAAPASAAAPTCNTTYGQLSESFDNEGQRMWTTLPYYAGAGYGTSACNLYRGMTGAHVEALQRTLKGCWGQPIGIDGRFGPATQNAVRNVQRAVGVAADGNYGPNTRRGIQNHDGWWAVSGGLASQWPVCDAVLEPLP